MVSYVVISIIALLGLILSGAIVSVILYFVHRHDMYNRYTNRMRAPSLQFQPRALSGKPPKVLTQDELLLLSTAELDQQELTRLMQHAANKPAEIETNDSCVLNVDLPKETPPEMSHDTQRETSEETSAETSAETSVETSVEARHSRSYFTQDCSVCLNDFEPGDTARILCCGHYFHKDCIDAWLTKHSTSCPVCKTDMVAALNLPQRPSPVVTAAASQRGSSTDVSSALPSPPLVPSVHRANRQHSPSYNTYVPMSMMAA